MTPAQVGEIVLVHHGIVAATPFLAPTLIITLAILALTLRDRRRPPSA